MTSRKRKLIKAKLARKNDRLQLLYEQERKILEGGVKAYGIGSRNLTRYDLDLKEVEDAIEMLEDEIDALEAALNGESVRPTFAAVPRDW